MRMRSYEDLLVWQKSMLLAKKVYLVQRRLPKTELYGIGDQIRRAVVSVPSNIAEGFGRGSDAEFNRFLLIARGSLFEVKTQLQLANELGLLQLEPELIQLIDEVGKLISGLSRTLTANCYLLTATCYPLPANST